MASQWFYARNGQRHGPVNSAQLTALAKSGQLLPADLIWKEGMTQWVPAGSSPQLFPRVQGSVPSVVPQDKAGLPAVAVTAARPTKSWNKYRRLVAGVQVLAISSLLIGTGYYLLQQPVLGQKKPAVTKPHEDDTPLNPPPPTQVAESAAEASSTYPIEPTESQLTDKTSASVRVPITHDIVEKKSEPTRSSTTTSEHPSPSQTDLSSARVAGKPAIDGLDALEEIMGLTPGPPHPLTEMVQEHTESDKRRSEHACFIKYPQIPLVMAVAPGVSDMPSRVHLWCSKSGKKLKEASTEDSGLYCPMAFRPDGSEFVSIDGEYLRLWKTEGTEAFILSDSRKISQESATKTPYPDISRLVWANDVVLLDRESLYGKRRLTAFEVKDHELSDGVTCQQQALLNRLCPTIAVSESLIATVTENESLRQALVVFSDSRTAKPVGSIPVTSLRISALPHPEPASVVRESDGIREGPATALRFVGHGERLLAASGPGDSPSPSQLGVLDPVKRKIKAVIDVPAGGRVQCVDPQGNYVAIVSYEVGLSTTSAVVAPTCSVYSLLDGSAVCEIKSPQWVQKYERNKLLTGLGKEVIFPTSLTVAFNDDGTFLTTVGIYSGILHVDCQPHRLSMGGIESEKSLDVEVNIQRWRVKDGSNVGTIGTVRNEPRHDSLGNTNLKRYRYRDLQLIDSSTAILGLFDDYRVIDIDGAIAVAETLNASHVAWSQGRHGEAFDGYKKSLSSPMRWLLLDQLALVVGRCVDAAAVTGDVGVAERLLAWCRDHSVAVKCETAQGRTAQTQWQSAEDRRVALEQEEKRRAQELRARQQEQRYAEMRKRNRDDAINSTEVSKKAFIEKLRSKMDRGRIDDLVVQAFFEDYTFQDVFGDPATDVAFDDVRRLYHYRCNDGVIQLTVLVNGGLVVLSGINLF